jgi:hypothetical protein
MICGQASLHADWLSSQSSRLIRRLRPQLTATQNGCKKIVETGE